MEGVWTTRQIDTLAEHRGLDTTLRGSHLWASMYLRPTPGVTLLPRLISGHASSRASPLLHGGSRRRSHVSQRLSQRSVAADPAGTSLKNGCQGLLRLEQGSQTFTEQGCCDGYNEHELASAQQDEKKVTSERGRTGERPGRRHQLRYGRRRDQDIGGTTRGNRPAQPPRTPAAIKGSWPCTGMPASRHVRTTAAGDQRGYFWASPRTSLPSSYSWPMGTVEHPRAHTSARSVLSRIVAVAKSKSKRSGLTGFYAEGL